MYQWQEETELDIWGRFEVSGWEPDTVSTRNGLPHLMSSDHGVRGVSAFVAKSNTPNRFNEPAITNSTRWLTMDKECGADDNRG